MVVSADGRLPALLPDLEAGEFWEQAAANGFAPFLEFSIDLPEGDPLADAVPYGAGGGSFPLQIVLAAVAALLAVGTGLWWKSRRGGSPVASPGLPPLRAAASRIVNARLVDG